MPDTYFNDAGTPEQGIAAGDERFTTSNSTPKTLKTLDLSGQNSLTVLVLITATIDGTQSFRALVIGGFRNPGLETATLAGSEDGDVIGGYSGGWATGPTASKPRVRFAVSGALALVQVVGVDGQTINGSFTLVQAKTE